MERQLRVAVLVCHALPSVIASQRGPFDRLFSTWLNAAIQSRDQHADTIKLHVTDWNVKDGNYPPSLDDVDAVIVTGSTASAYDDVPWIHRLAAYLADVYQNHARVKIFGGCFGHQIVAQTLLLEQGVRVEKNPQGWEVGVHAMTVLPEFAACFQTLKTLETLEKPRLSMQYLHADHVIAERGIPEGWAAMGSTALCGLQGLLLPGRVLTYQGHPEFDVFINSQTVDQLAGSGMLTEDEVARYRALVDMEDDRALAGEVALEFLLS